MGCLVLRAFGILAGDVVGERDWTGDEDDGSDFSRLGSMSMTSDRIPTQ